MVAGSVMEERTVAVVLVGSAVAELEIEIVVAVGCVGTVTVSVLALNMMKDIVAKAGHYLVAARSRNSLPLVAVVAESKGSTGSGLAGIAAAVAAAVAAGFPADIRTVILFLVAEDSLDTGADIEIERVFLAAGEVGKAGRLGEVSMRLAGAADSARESRWMPVSPL